MEHVKHAPNTQKLMRQGGHAIKRTALRIDQFLTLKETVKIALTTHILTPMTPVV